MALELNGTTGVSLVQDGVVDFDAIAPPDYLSVVFPDGDTDTVTGIQLSDITQNLSNNLSVSIAGVNPGDVFTYASEHTISGFSSGIYEFNIFFCMDRNSNNSIIQLMCALYEDDSTTVRCFDETITQGYGGASLNIIKDYTSSIPSSVVIHFEADRNNYIPRKGAGYTIKRIA